MINKRYIFEGVRKGGINDVKHPTPRPKIKINGQKPTQAQKKKAS